MCNIQAPNCYVYITIDYNLLLLLDVFSRRYTNQVGSDTNNEAIVSPNALNTRIEYKKVIVSKVNRN